MYQPQLDVDALVAIDMHTHAEVDSHGHGALSPELVRSSYWGTGLFVVG